jgi:hypothetical protein
MHVLLNSHFAENPSTWSGLTPSFHDGGVTTVSKAAGGERERGQSGASSEHEEGKWEWGALLLGAGTGIRLPTYVGRWWGSGRGGESNHWGDRCSGGHTRDRVPIVPCWKWYWATDKWALAHFQNFPNIQKSLKFVNSKWMPFIAPKISKLCMRLVSYPVFMPKPSTHHMHDPGSIVPHIRPKVITDNQMSWIKYSYYIKMSKYYDDSQRNGTTENSITPQEWQLGQHIA